LWVAFSNTASTYPKRCSPPNQRHDICRRDLFLLCLISSWIFVSESNFNVVGSDLALTATSSKRSTRVVDQVRETRDQSDPIAWKAEEKETLLYWKTWFDVKHARILIFFTPTVERLKTVTTQLSNTSNPPIRSNKLLVQYRLNLGRKSWRFRPVSNCESQKNHSIAKFIARTAAESQSPTWRSESVGTSRWFDVPNVKYIWHCWHGDQRGWKDSQNHLSVKKKTVWIECHASTWMPNSAANAEALLRIEMARGSWMGTHKICQWPRRLNRNSESNLPAWTPGYLDAVWEQPRF